jgi:hypothetical protein
VAHSAIEPAPASVIGKFLVPALAIRVGKSMIVAPDENNQPDKSQEVLRLLILRR